MEEQNPFILNQSETDLSLDDDDSNVSTDQVNPFLIQDAPPAATATATDPNIPEEVRSSPFAYLDGEENQELIGTAVDLPAPNTTMYNDIEVDSSFSLEQRREAAERAEQRYRFYRDHPESERSFLGEVIYRGQVVPPPDQGFFSGDMGVDTSTKVVGGVRNAVRNAGEFVGAGVDAASNRLFGGDLNLTERAQGMARLDTGDSVLDSIITEGSGLAVGGLGGLRLVQMIPKLTNIPIVGRAAQALGFEGGIAASASSDAGTFLIGENALLSGIQPNFMRGFEADPDSEEYQQVLAARANIFIDALAATKVLEAGVQGTVWTARTLNNIFIRPFTDTVNMSAREEQFVRDTLDVLTGTGTDPQAQAEARERLVNLIEENKDLYVDMDPELAADVATTVDTMTALERALANDNSEEARQIIAAAQARRQGILNQSGGAPQTATAVARPTNELERITQQTEEALGGSEAIQGSAEGLQRSGIDEVAEAGTNVNRLEVDLQNLENDVVRLIQEDPSMIGKITRLEDSTGFDIYQGRNQASDEIVANVRRASEQMDTRKNQLFNAVEGGAVDYDALIDQLQRMRPGQLDAAVNLFPANSQVGTLMDQLRPRTIGQGEEAVQETAEQVRERVSGWMAENNVDFAFLYTDLRPGLTLSINNLERANTPESLGAAQALVSLKRYIDGDALDYLEEVGDEATLDAARTAMYYFRNEWAPFWDDGDVLERVGQLRRETTQRGMQEGRFTRDSRQALEGSLTDANREVGRGVIQLLDRPEAGQNVGLVTDYVVGDALGTLSSRIDSVDKLPDLDLSSVRQSLSQYGTLIRENFPDEAARIDSLVDRLGQLRGDRDALRLEINTAREAAEAAKDRIYNQELNAFFSSEGITNPNGYASFAQVFDNAQSADVISGLLDRARASNNPVLLEGMQAAYSRWFRNKFLGSSRATGGDRNIMMRNLQQSEEEILQAIDYGRQVFEDRPVVIGAFDTMLQEAGIVQRGRGVRAIPQSSNTAALNEQIAAVNRGITATLGVLSRVGARIRTTATGFLQRNFDEQAFLQMSDALMANPDEFIDVARRVINQDNQIDRTVMYQMLVRIGIYREGDDEQREDFFAQMADIELEMRRQRNDLDDQMEDAFNTTPDQ
jgi:hypothetical protein